MLATVLGNVAVILVVAIGTLILAERTPTGFIALAALALGQSCPKCMAAVLTGRSATGRRTKTDTSRDAH